MREVYVRLTYVEDLKTGLPISYLEFWLAMQDLIDADSQQAFSEDRPLSVDPQYDIVEIRGHWVEGNCDYVAVLLSDQLSTNPFRPDRRRLLPPLHQRRNRWRLGVD